MVGDKNMVSIVNSVVGYIFSEREKLGLPAPAPDSRLSAAAGDTAVWFGSKEKGDFEDKIFEYLRHRMVEQPGDATYSILFPWLVHCRHYWLVETPHFETAKYLIENMGLSEVARDPTLDYLGVGSHHTYFDQSGNPVEITGFDLSGNPVVITGGQPVALLGCALVVACATDGSSTIVDRINERRGRVGAAPLQISVPLSEVARKFITSPPDDVTLASLFEEAHTYGYATEGLQAHLNYMRSLAELPRGREISVTVPEMADITSAQISVTAPEMADIIAARLLEDWPILLHPDWQDIGIATGAKNHPNLGGLYFGAEVIIGWRIPYDAERPAHFPSPMD